MEPGNWGRMLRLYTPHAQPNAWLLIRELVYEDIRGTHYPNKPSRLQSTFLCVAEADIHEFRTSYNRMFDIAYEVEVVDGNASAHVGDWTLPNMVDTDNVQVFENRAHLYWQAQSIVKQEVVTLSPVRVLRRL